MQAEPNSTFCLGLMSDRVCAFLADLRPLSCTASGLVTSANWRAKAEQLWPGATAASLPGSPKFQVRVLSGARPHAPHQPIDAGQLSSCAHESKVLLGLKRRRDNTWLWRAAGQIALRGSAPLGVAAASNYPTSVITEFALPREVGQTLEGIIEQWVQGNHSSRPGSPECDVACLLQVWIPVLGGSPIVAQPQLPLDGVRYGLREGGDIVGNLDFYNDGVCLAALTHRSEGVAHGMRGATAGKVMVFCGLPAVGRRSGSILADALTRLCSV